jgi:TPR repeat protein
MSKLYRRTMSRIFYGGWLLPLVLSTLIGCAKLDKPEQPIASTEKAESFSLMSGDELFVEALRYENDLNDREKDYKKSIALLHMAESKGSIEAASLLSLVYYEGSYSVEKDYRKAFHFADKSANLGSVDGMNTLGNFYLRGVGVSIDKEKAFYWYKKAAEQGDKYGQANVGTSYLNGTGVKRDLKKAEYWLRKAAQQGVNGAKRNYAQLLCFRESIAAKDCDLNRDLHLDTPMNEVEP